VINCIIDLDEGARMYGQLTDCALTRRTWACGCKRISLTSARKRTRNSARFRPSCLASEDLKTERDCLLPARLV
jgi:hypothetical protein